MSTTHAPERLDGPPRGGTSRVTFDRFELDLTTGELTRDGEFVPMKAQVAKALVHLTRNAGHLVPRQQLIELLWPDRIVEYDQGLNSIIRTLRSIFEDDPQQPRYIETLPRQGYRFIAKLSPSPFEEKEPEEAETPVGEPSRVHRSALVAAVGIGMLLVVSLYLAASRHTVPDARNVSEAGGAVAVLPLSVQPSETTGFEWVRLGAMDAIAGRLRESGLATTPSETVISTLQASGNGLPAGERTQAVRRVLGVAFVVDGEARWEADGWTIQLVATDADGSRRRVVSGPSEVIAAATRAADLLLAALGQPVATGHARDAVLGEVLQRARAATLALELDTARSILAEAAGSLRDDPELLHQLAWIEHRAGRHDEAVAVATGLVEDPVVKARPRLLAKVLVVRGLSEGARRSNAGAGIDDLDTAVTSLQGADWAPELATALAARGAARSALGEFDDATRDLGRARVLYEAAADRLGVMEVDAHFGHLELNRGRPAAALPHFQHAIELSETLGALDALRGALFGLWNAQNQLLRRSDALITSERLFALRDRIRDPARRHGVGIARAAALTYVGRLSEAAAILDELRELERDDRPFLALSGERARAHLAWHRGDSVATMDAAARAMHLWSRSRRHRPEFLLDFALLHQRASIAAGRPARASQTLAAVLEVSGSRETGEGPGILQTDPASLFEMEPAYLVAEAEWAAHQDDHQEAERLLRAALDHAEADGIPGFIVPSADAYARWLLDRGRVTEATALAGRVANWADDDYRSALLQVAVLRAAGQQRALDEALQRARRLAGEREISSED